MTRTTSPGPSRKQMSDLRKAVKMTRSGSVAEYEALHNFAASYYGPPARAIDILKGLYRRVTSFLFLGG
mgnify:FL=1